MALPAVLNCTVMNVVMSSTAQGSTWGLKDNASFERWSRWKIANEFYTGHA
jgi:hypothetical protein